MRAREDLGTAGPTRRRAVEARLLNTLAIAAETRGDPVAALDLDRQSLQLHRDNGDRINEAIGLSNLGGGWLNLGDLAQARRELDAALQLLRANGDRVVEGTALINLSVLALWQGEETRALALARQALDIAVAVQVRDKAVGAGVAMGHAELALGRGAAARQAYTQALQQALEIDDPMQHDARAGLARVALNEGDTAVALAALQPLLDLIAAGGTLDRTEYLHQIELTCHQALARAADPRADAWLMQAHTALMAQAETITDATLRQGFLTNIPHHREIVAACRRRGAGAPGAAAAPG